MSARPWSDGASPDICDAAMTFLAGRVCAHEGCNTVLSRYNPDDYCALHCVPEEDEPIEPVRRRARPILYTYDGRRICTSCGQAYPPTTEYFHRSKSHTSGLNPECKACANERNRRDRAKFRKGEVKGVKRKQCRVCGRRLPLDQFEPSSRAKSGLSNRCRECADQAAQIAAAEKAKVAREKGLVRVLSPRGERYVAV